MNRHVLSTTAINTYSLRRCWLSSLLFAVALALSWTTNADAATVVYLQWSDSSISGPGGGVVPRGAIELTSYSQNDSNPVTLTGGAGNRSSKPTCGQVTIMKQLDNTSPDFLAKVFEGSLTNPTVPVTITFEKVSAAGAAGLKFYTVQLYEVAVTSITQSDVQGGLVNETIMLEARRFRFSYTPQNTDGLGGGAVTFGWDCVSNRAF